MVEAVGDNHDSDNFHENLIYSITRLRMEEMKKILSSLLTKEDSDKEKLKMLAEAVMENLSQEDWTGVEGYGALLKYGVYSPLQILFNAASNIKGNHPDCDYPFLFGTIANLASLLIDNEHVTDNSSSDRYRKIFQTIFQMREMREEGENLSIETYLPSGLDKNAPLSSVTLELKKLGQIFGRGTGIVTALEFEKRTDVHGGPIKVFDKHDGAPSTMLYALGSTNTHVPKSNLAVALRRDRVVSISATNNPLLEFYDGGWHITDLSSGGSLLDYCLSQYDNTDNNIERTKITNHLLLLAYHMATHWHSGILAVIDYNKADSGKVLEKQSEWSINATEIIRDSLGGDLNIANLDQSKYGRVLLTNAIQDGATIFLSNGQFHSAGRVVTSFDGSVSDQKLGTGNRAARRLSQFGVALKISEDGAIRLYSSKPKDYEAINVGIRIR
ncbi:MAG: hypothetical protein AAE986_06175 [Thermoplasmataceae archaeon]|jgi:hypothetical protein